MNKKDKVYEAMAACLNFEDRSFANEEVLALLMTSIDTAKLKISTLDEVFKAAINALKTKPTFENAKAVSKDMGKAGKLYHKFFFIYDNQTWRGTIVYHNFQLQDEMWCTVNIKLPNDGYFYSKSSEDPAFKNSLKLSELEKLSTIKPFVFKFFGARETTFEFFYMPKRNRFNITARCNAEKMELCITFENGYPEKYATTKNYSSEELNALLAQIKAE